MSSRLYIDFVFEEGTDTDQLVELMKTYLTGNDDAAVSDRDADGQTTFTAWITLNDVRVELNTKAYDADADWFTIPKAPTIEVQVSTPAFDSSTGVDPETLPSIVKQMYATVTPRPAYAYGLDEGHVEIIGEDGPESLPIPPETLEAGNINAVSWLMLFSPSLVESYDREFLLDAPAWRTEELADGAILIIACADPTDYGALDESLRELKEYFGTEHPRL